MGSNNTLTSNKTHKWHHVQSFVFLDYILSQRLLSLTPLHFGFATNSNPTLLDSILIDCLSIVSWPYPSLESWHRIDHWYWCSPVSPFVKDPFPDLSNYCSKRHRLSSVHNVLQQPETFNSTVGQMQKALHHLWPVGLKGRYLVHCSECSPFRNRP